MLINSTNHHVNWFTIWYIDRRTVVSFGIKKHYFKATVTCSTLLAHSQDIMELGAMDIHHDIVKGSTNWVGEHGI